MGRFTQLLKQKTLPIGFRKLTILNVSINSYLLISQSVLAELLIKLDFLGSGAWENPAGLQTRLLGETGTCGSSTGLTEKTVMRGYSRCPRDVQP